MHFICSELFYCFSFRITNWIFHKDNNYYPLVRVFENVIFKDFCQTLSMRIDFLLYCILNFFFLLLSIRMVHLCYCCSDKNGYIFLRIFFGKSFSAVYFSFRRLLGCVPHSSYLIGGDGYIAGEVICYVWDLCSRKSFTYVSFPVFSPQRQTRLPKISRITRGRTSANTKSTGVLMQVTVDFWLP